jgi:hypothetical protein
MSASDASPTVLISKESLDERINWRWSERDLDAEAAEEQAEWGCEPGALLPQTLARARPRLEHLAGPGRGTSKRAVLQRLTDRTLPISPQTDSTHEPRTSTMRFRASRPGHHWRGVRLTTRRHTSTELSASIPSVCRPATLVTRVVTSTSSRRRPTSCLPVTLCIGRRSVYQRSRPPPYMRRQVSRPSV